MKTERTKKYYKIVDMIFCIDTFCDEAMAGALRDYEVDECEADFCITAQMTDDTIPEPECKKLTERNYENWYSPCNGVYEFRLYEPAIDRFIVGTRIDMNNCTAHIDVADITALCGIEFAFFLYNAVQDVFRVVMLFHDAFAFHASCVVYKGEAVAFSALSGTGKSTHTALWLKNYPNDTTILNDDRPVFRFIDGKWYAYGTPWAGTTGINSNMRVPLKAVVFLERAAENSIRTCSVLEIIHRFFEAVDSPVSDEMSTMMLNSLDKLVRNNKICVLRCNMDDSAAETVREYIFSSSASRL